RNGYARQEYGQRVFGGQGRVVTLVAGQAMTGIAFHLTPAGSVSGVVKDSSGEPLPGALVQLLRPTYNSAGQRTLQTAGGDRTNDRGEYRLYWITPGRYYVAVNGAAPARAVTLLGGTGSFNEILERRYSTSYHPGTVDVSQASVVDVQPGVELTAVDVMVADQGLFHVRGRIVDPITQRSPGTASVSIVGRGPTAAPIGLSSSAPTYNSADGTFDFRDVAPGAYWIRATAGSSADSLLPANAAGRTLADVFVHTLFSERRVSQAPLDVFSDIDGLVLTLGSGVSIRGLVSVEGQPLSAVERGERLEITLRPATTGMLMNPSRHQPLRPDGAFTLENVLPGEYVVTAQSLPPGYYLKDTRIEHEDAFDRPLVVSGPLSGTLNVVLSSKGGQIEGVVVDARQRAVSGIQAVLVPDRRPARLDLYRTAVTDQSGGFTIRGISPGDYKVFAWEAIESFGYFDEEFLRQSDQYGTSVRIAESSRERVDVTVIPAPLR
ncbi:MAG: carboxypeptidase regulatory-like domain-containing protein, partial [Vicinamibacterales bacterium]